MFAFEILCKFHLYLSACPLFFWNDGSQDLLSLKNHLLEKAGFLSYTYDMRFIKKLLSSPYIHQMRPRQYTKNAFIYAPLFFDRQLFNPHSFLITTLGFITLCILSSAVYVLNDIVDVDSDRNHPQKKYRPSRICQTRRESLMRRRSARNGLPVGRKNRSGPSTKKP